MKTSTEARERNRRWYWKDPERTRAMKRSARAARLQAITPEELARYKARRAEAHRKWRNKNLDYLRESKREHYIKNQNLIVKKQRERYARRTYSLTLEDIAAMLESQNGKCAICLSDSPGGRGRNWYIDHDHETKRVRGLLCSGCNIGLGHMKDNPERLRAAAAYLEKVRG